MQMDWIRDHSALNRFFFLSNMPPAYCPDVKRLFYLQCEDVYSICCSLILASGEFATAEAPIDGSVPMIIFYHGTGSNVGTCYRFARRLAIASQCHVLLFDYPGYGLSLSSHHPNESSAYLSTRILLDHVIQRMEVPVSNLILCGHSLGTALATYGMEYCCTRYVESVGGLILLNPFLSMREAAQDIVPLGCLILERLNTQARIGKCQAPVLIIHGHQDPIIPVHQGITLYNQVSGIKESWFPLDATHDHCDLGILYHKITDFIAQNIVIQPCDAYLNITPRIAPEIDTSNGPSILTETVATVAEITTGVIADSYRSCILL